MSNPSTTGNVGHPTIKILLVDTLLESLEHLKSLLHCEQDFEVVETACEWREAVQKARELRPDIVIIDLDVPEALKAMAQMTKSLPATGVIGIAASHNSEHWQQILLAGGRGLLVKPSDLDEMLYFTIRNVHKQYEPIHCIFVAPSQRRKDV